MDLFDAIDKRHSYRDAFSTQPIPRDDLTKIVTAGLMAPSGCNKQTTEFLIVDDPALIAQVAAMPGVKACLKTAQALILCLTNTNPPSAVYNLSFELQDCAAAVENMLLAITGLGYATVWIDGWLKGEGRAEQIATWMKVPSHKTIQVMLPVGIPTNPVSAPPKKSFNERACFNTYSLT